ncbi:MAG: hypothetical protein ABI700_03805 [Chloroflexota bacterium]
MSTRILVINNSDDILALFKKILTTDDREVFIQFFLNSDLRGVRAIKPDLIILDYYVGGRCRLGISATAQNGGDNCCNSRFDLHDCRQTRP